MRPPRGSSGVGSHIVRVRADAYIADTEDGISMSFGPLQRRSMVLIQIETADGRLGYGESWTNFPAWAAQERLLTLRQGVFPLIQGKDAADIEALRHQLLLRLEPLGRQAGASGPIIQSISAVDIALWDLAGKACDRSVGRLIGSIRRAVTAYASSAGPTHAAEQAARCAEDGFDALKVKVGFGKRRDREILAGTRSAVGDAMLLYADANQAWNLDEAIDMAAELRRFGVAWIEEPVRGNALADLEELHRQTGLQIATGENLYGRQAFESYARSPAVSILQPDVTKTGGISEVLDICTMASNEGKTVIPHLYGGPVALAATLQVAACCPAVAAIEYDIRDNPLRGPVWPGAPVPKDGIVSIPDTAGLGIDLDFPALANYIAPYSDGES